MATILETRNVSKHFGAVKAADDISVAIAADSVVGLIGTNGAGKTTFVNMITGYLKPTHGTIHFGERDITPLESREITRLGICRSFQIAQLYDSMSVEENLLIGLGVARRNARPGRFGRLPANAPGHSGTPEEAARSMMETFGLTDWRDKLARTLPGGVRKLLDIAMALVQKPRVLLLDEPTSGVSSDEKFTLMELVMGAVRKEGVTVLFVEHDMDIVARYTHRVLAFYEGRIIADETPEEVLADPDVRRYVIGNTTTHGRGGAHA